MAEEQKKKEAAEEVQPQTAELPARPNRDKYASMWSEDNPDVDFEDKEARYGRMAEERERYRSLKESGGKLTQALDKNRWLGAMFQDLAENPDKNPLVWMVDNGIDVKGALEDPNIMAQVDEAFKGWQQKQVDGEEATKNEQANFNKSLEALKALQDEYGFSDEQFDRMWEHFWDEVFAPAFNGEVAKDTWLAMLHAMNYDEDIKNAREESAMQARNEKHANKVKTFDERQVPPTFSQGKGRATSNTQKEESLMDFIKRNR